MIPATPRVAVIVAAHNAAATLGATLDSLLEQTHEDWEAVVADDASTDDTAAIAEAASARSGGRIRVVRLARNVGPAGARNAAVAASSDTELLALLDADDRYLPHYLERQMARWDEAVAAGRRVGIATCDALLLEHDGFAPDTFADRFGWADPVTLDAMLEAGYVYIGSMLSRAAYEAVGGFSTECWGSEDYDLWLRIMERGYHVVVTREPLAVYNLAAQGVSSDQLTMAVAGIAAYRRVLGRGALDRRQRRRARARLRHYLALRERALLLRAVRERRPRAAVRAAARALPLGAVAAAQEPRRWGEWARQGLRSLRKPKGPGPRPSAPA